MATTTQTIQLESLLEHRGWVQTLAHQLVRDPDLAEDLTQETMLAALEAHGEPVRSPRAWLGRVLRNLLWERLRGEGRRRKREAAVAKTDAEPSSAELVERVDAHRSVVNAVMGLPEHYRLIMLHRYFLDESPSAIAAALDMPVATVKTRLQRGLEQLRGELDRQYGGAEKRRRALVPLLPVTGAKIPVLGMVAVALVMLGGAAVVWQVTWGATVPVQPPSARIEIDAGAAGVAPSTEGPDAPTRVAADLQSQGEIDWGDVKMPPRALAGAALYADGTPAPSLLLRFVPDRERDIGTQIAVSGSDGAFELTARGSGVVEAAPGRAVTLLAAVAGAADVSKDLCVVVAPSRSLVGRVLDATGSPLAEAAVEVVSPASLRARFGPRIANASTTRYLNRTDGDGRFEMAAVPQIDGATLVVSREGYATHREPMPANATVEVVLAAPALVPGGLAGQVLGPDGGPAFDARVACGSLVTRSDRTGAFHLPKPGDADTTLIAAMPGMQPALLRVGPDGWPKSIVLRLGGALRAIRGRVLRQDGKPASKARVWVADPTLLVYQPGAGQQTASSRFGAVRMIEGSARYRRAETLEGYLQSTGTPWSPAMADAEGNFELTGLCDRDYLVAAGDPVTLQRSVPVRCTAGSEGAELHLLGDARAKIGGRVVDRLGRPMARVAVALQFTVCELVAAGKPVYQQLYRRGAMMTGPDGEFWLYDVPTQGVSLHLSGVGLIAHTLPLDDITPPLLVEMTRATTLWVKALDPTTLDSIAVHDADGNALKVKVRRGNESQNSLRLPLQDGRTEAFVLPATAMVVVGYRDDEIVRRASVPAGGGELVF